MRVSLQMGIADMEYKFCWLIFPTYLEEAICSRPFFGKKWWSLWFTIVVLSGQAFSK